MKVIQVVVFISFLLSCNPTNSEIIRKQINSNGVTIKWFYYSYITNTSPDFVVIEKAGERKEIYQAEDAILNVDIYQQNIILKLVKLSEGVIYTKKNVDDVFGYNVILDTSGTSSELQLIPDGIK